MAGDGDEDDNRPVAGFFGKLPSIGDFVERGLPPAFRRSWDHWLTTHIAPRARAGARFPQGGLRFKLVSGGTTAGGVILPSRDSVGRVFPLTLLAFAGGGMQPASIDRWSDEAVAAFEPGVAPEALWAMLDALAPPKTTAAAGEPCIWLWAANRQPEVFSDSDDGLLAGMLPVAE